MENCSRSFVRNCAGNVGAMLAIVAVPVVLAAGSAVDYMRKNDARDTLVAIVDASVLAGAQALVDNDGNKSTAEKVAEEYFSKAVANENYPWNLNIKFKAKGDGLAMESKGSATLDTSIMAIVGIDEMSLYPLGATEGAEAVIGGTTASNLEVVLMLDVTGSMCEDGTGPCTSGAKFDAMKKVAEQLVDDIVWADQSQVTSRVAIVPFSTRVRVGPDGGGGEAMQLLTKLPPTWSGYTNSCTKNYVETSGSETSGSYSCEETEVVYREDMKVKPCVTDRHSNASEDFVYSDSKPSSEDWFNAHNGSRFPISLSSDETPATEGLGKTADDPLDDWNYNMPGICDDVHVNNEIQGLTSNKVKLKDKINSLVAYGSTSGVLGTSFAWIMLQPDFANMFGADVAPASYDDLSKKNASGTAKVRKIAILMTDGVYNTYRGWKDQDRKTLVKASEKMCKEIKNKGVEIYAVGYELDSLSPLDRSYAEETLQACGSTVDHFYNSLNTAKLQQDFESIASNLGGGSIRLVK